MIHRIKISEYVNAMNPGREFARTGRGRTRPEVEACRTRGRSSSPDRKRTAVFNSRRCRCAWGTRRLSGRPRFGRTAKAVQVLLRSGSCTTGGYLMPQTRATLQSSYTFVPKTAAQPVRHD